MDNTLDKFKPILEEQYQQIKKWGEQNHHPFVYQNILVEEVGEVSQAILQTEFEDTGKNYWDVIEELDQVMAVAQSMKESILRNQLK
jgi:NTP pyrophosphatase (non-canonical NTP hydrolase)